MINQKESKKVRMGSWLQKTTVKRHENKLKTKINQQTIIKKKNGKYNI